MNGEKIATLQQLLPVKDELLETCMQDDLSQKERKALDQALAKINAIERLIIDAIGEQLVEALKRDSDDLNVLSEEISRESEKLLSIAQKIKKSSEVINALAKAVTGAISIGQKNS